MLGRFLKCFFKGKKATLNTSQDVEDCTKIPFLGFIPYAQEEAKDKEEMELIAQQKPHSKTAQAFKKVKESLSASSSLAQTFKVLVITGVTPGEGSSFVTANLAISFADAKEPTLLIDADMRRGRQEQAFKVNNKEGLIGVLGGACSWQEATVPTTIPNLCLLPSGLPTSNLAELLNSDKFKQFLDQATEKFKRIIIDSPPILNVADALAVAKACDGLVFVARKGCTQFKHILEAKKIAEKNTKVLGAILNSAGPKN